MSFDPSITPLTWRRVGRFAVWSDGTRLPIISGGDGEDTLTELLARAGNVTEQSDEELAQLDADITAAATALAEGGNVTDEQLEQLEAAGAAVQTIRAEQESRDAAAAERAERAAAALALVRGDSEDEDPEGEPEAEDETTDEDETPPVIEAEAEPPAADPVPEPIAAAARRRPLTRVAARRPAATAPRPSSTPSSPFGNTHIVASANAPGLPSGQRILNYDQLARGFVAAIEASRNYQGAVKEIPIFTIGRGQAEYPESHWMSNRDPHRNTELARRTQSAIRAAGGLQAAISNGIQAAGGICAPSQVRYDLPGIDATDARPLRDDFMTRFGADRGSIKTLPGPVIEDLNGASSWWTNDNDITPGSDGETTKPCLTVTCPDDENESLVEAAVTCLKYGNFRARYFPEQIARWMELMGAAHARLAELRLLAAVSTGATSTLTVGQTLGTVRDLLAGLDRIRAVWNYRHRTGDGFTLQIALPRWLRDQIRSDVTRQLPTGSVTDTLQGLSDAQIDALIRGRNFEPTWLLDGESGQGFNAQGAGGTVQGWPSTVKTYIAPAGSWLHLDGGELNLGVMRDTTTTATNDVQFFAETMEAPHFFGIESWVVTFDTCPDGSVSSTVDINPCSTGS